jgi:D-alanyl-D-alanine-carboxypeptidase/D-alanyl-D-alanine-endopeptidase
MRLRFPIGSSILMLCGLGAVSGNVANAAPETATSKYAALPSEANIRALLAQRVKALGGENAGIGIVVGVIGSQGRRIISYGQSGNARSLDGDTAFEIGSVTKVFTALLLADMVQRGEVALSDPVTKYLPAVFSTPQRGGPSITLADLATHTSGLPFMPDDLPPFDDAAATKDADSKIYGFVAHYKLPSEIGTEWNYSNIGYWLLAKVMASQDDKDYETLLRERILVPLRLEDTAITVSPALKTKLAVGHNAILQPAPLFSSIPVYGAMPSAGGLVSTTNDLLAFLAYVMGYEPSPLAPSMAAMLRIQRPMDDSKQALGWVASGSGGDELIFHEGGSFGYVSALVWSPVRRIGVVILSNQMRDVSDIARHLLQPASLLERPAATAHTEIALGDSALETYEGRYQGPDGVGAFIVTRAGKNLIIEVPNDWGLPRFHLHPHSRTDFFVAEIPMRVSFQLANGHANGLLIYPPRGQHAIAASLVSP